MTERSGSRRDSAASAWRVLRGSRASERRLYYGRPSVAHYSLLRRLLLVIALLAAVVVVFWFDRAGLRDHHDGSVSFTDVIYFALITITTVGYGDIVPVSDSARLIDAFFVTPVRLFVWAIFLGTAYQVVARRLIEDFRMRIRHKRHCQGTRSSAASGSVAAAPPTNSCVAARNPPASW